ncbi:MAG: hypothetical protein EPO06_01540 [Burkholderiaceae bacterium]|nr:MAG: hypothetical protein EPO06_01540 [Burkholderiaceae bacterium]
MDTPIKACCSATIITLGLSLGWAVPALAAEDPTLNKDLTSVIALLGLPCGQVVSAITKGDNDHIAICTDGNRYHVFMNAQGRVVAEKQ